MIWIVRSLAGATVAAGILVGLYSGGPYAPSASEGTVRASAIQASASGDDWRRATRDYLRARRAPLEPEEIDAVIRAVASSSQRFGVDAVLVLAVMEVESRFDPYAVSPRGAVGLMQLLPETARDLALRRGVDLESDEALFDPTLNIELGTCYLQELLARFGDLDAALAAYHAGPGRVEAKLARSERPSPAYSNRVWSTVFAIQARASA